MKIAIIHTSKGRPQIANVTAWNWLDQAWYPARVKLEYWIGYETNEAAEYGRFMPALDAEFPGHIKQLPIQGQCLTLENLPEPKDMHRFLTSHTKNNMLVNCAKADWFFCVADNFLPFHDWLREMMPYLEKYKGTETLLNYPNEHERGLAAHPVFTKEFFHWHGDTMMRTEYPHAYADVDLFHTAKLGGKLVMLPITFRPLHKHPYLNQLATEDDLNRFNYSPVIFAMSRNIWEQRKKILGVA